MYRWSGQIIEPADGLAFIGKNPGDENIYIITGDSGNGITHAAIASELIPDLIHGRKSQWSEMYDPSRKVTGAIGTFVKEAANSVAQYKNYLTGNGDESLDTIERGSGAVIDKTAVYRDGDGHLHAFSAICPHLKCLVRRNDEEQSFDCPCHGSRFSFDGKVVNGPANVNLEETEIPTKKYKE